MASSRPLARYRAAVLDEKKGGALAKIVTALEKSGLRVGGETYKRPPQGTSPDHPRAKLLRHGGLYTMWSAKPPQALYGPELVELATEHFTAAAPLYRWLCAF